MEEGGKERKETNEKINETNKVVDKSYVIRKWLSVTTQWLMVGIVIIALWYLFNNIEAVKTAINPCQVCMDKFENIVCSNMDYSSYTDYIGK